MKGAAILTGKIIFGAIFVACVIILALGYFGVIPRDSQVEKAAEEVLETETGIEIKLPEPIQSTAGSKP